MFLTDNRLSVVPTLAVRSVVCKQLFSPVLMIVKFVMSISAHLSISEFIAANHVPAFNQLYSQVRRCHWKRCEEVLMVTYQW